MVDEYARGFRAGPRRTRQQKGLALPGERLEALLRGPSYRGGQPARPAKRSTVGLGRLVDLAESEADVDVKALWLRAEWSR